MTIISDAQARAHLRIGTGDDDANLATYTSAAEIAAQNYMNRNVYDDSAALAAAIAMVPTAMTAAETAYDNANDAADEMDSGPAQDSAYFAATLALNQAQFAAQRTLFGIVVDDVIRAGTLLILGHLWENRQDVLSGDRGIAIEIPQASQYILGPYRANMGP